MGEVTAIAKLINDPLLVFIFALFVLLAWVIFSLLRTIGSQVNYERELVSELNKTSQTVVRLTTLIETMVHGRGGPKHD
jgi:cell division protein FtsB